MLDVAYRPAPRPPTLRRHFSSLAAEEATQAALAAKLDEILKEQRREARNRLITFLIATGGAIFAAIRLGIIAFPKAREIIVERRARRASPAIAPGEEPKILVAPPAAVPAMAGALGRRRRQ